MKDLLEDDPYLESAIESIFGNIEDDTFDFDDTDPINSGLDFSFSDGIEGSTTMGTMGMNTLGGFGMGISRKEAFENISEMYEKTKNINNLNFVAVNNLDPKVIKRSGFIDDKNHFLSLDCSNAQKSVCVLKMKHIEIEYMMESEIECKIFPEDGNMIIKDLREYIKNSFKKADPIFTPAIDGKTITFNSDIGEQIIFELK